MPLANIVSPSVGCLLCFVDGFLCCAKTLELNVVPFVYFSFVSLACADSSKKRLLRSMSGRVLPIRFPGNCIALGLTLKCSIYFEFIPARGVREWSGSVALHVSVQCPQKRWLKRDGLYPMVDSCLLCQRLMDHIGMGLFLGSPFCSIGLCVCFYARTLLFWWLHPCCTVWYQVVWYLHLGSPFLRLLWLFVVFCGSI